MPELPEVIQLNLTPDQLDVLGLAYAATIARRQALDAQEQANVPLLMANLQHAAQALEKAARRSAKFGGESDPLRRQFLLLMEEDPDACCYCDAKQGSDPVCPRNPTGTHCPHWREAAGEGTS